MRRSLQLNYNANTISLEVSDTSCAKLRCSPDPVEIPTFNSDGLHPQACVDAQLSLDKF
jgi:hypothetical protein